MPKYRVNTKSFINNSVVDEGATIDYDGAPGLNLDPLDDAAVEAFEKANATRDRKGISTSDLTRQRVASLGGEPDAVELVQAASAASAAANAVLTGKSVVVDGKTLDSTPAPVTGAEGLV